ncbi:MAG: Hsp20/alpha crystallin family protein [Ruminococcus sp.]|nr:Hsp20/alpha crystallin family protein [Ruminococcus sp.]
MMYGMTPFGRNAFDLFNIWNDLDKNYDSMPVNACKTDIKDTGDKYVMESELPGFEKEDIKLDINGEFLVISAEHKSESEEKDEKTKYIRRERKFGSYKRSFDISDVDADCISAEYKNGILTIELPKKKPAEPVAKRLEIK